MDFTSLDYTMALRYFGVDWLAMVFTFAAIYLLGNKSRQGFALMICGNTCWIAIGVLTGSIAMIIANGAFLAMNARAWYRWAPQG